MATFYIRYRKTGPVEITTVEAATRDLAIEQIVKSVADGEEIQVMTVAQDTSMTGPTGITGTTGTTGTSGTSGITAR